nr:hypothetical protein [Tanacetum cinerariifolium]
PMVRDCMGESDLGSWDVVGSGENGGKHGREWLQGLSMLVLVAGEILKVTKLAPQNDDSAALVDGFAKGLTNRLPSNKAFGLSSSISCEVIGIFIAREDGFVGVGAVSSSDIDAVDV